MPLAYGTDVTLLLEGCIIKELDLGTERAAGAKFRWPPFVSSYAVTFQSVLE